MPAAQPITSCGPLDPTMNDRKVQNRMLGGLFPLGRISYGRLLLKPSINVLLKARGLFTRSLAGERG
jgi:hypothetical protein